MTPIRLYLMRHGHSLPISEAGVPRDFDRPLSDGGKEEARQMARYLLKEKGSPSIILHSPLKRAQQTALEAARIIKPKDGAEMFPPLSNVMPPDELFAELQKRISSLQQILAIGHQPQLGELVGWLCGHNVEIRTAGTVALEMTQENRAKILWSVNPSDIQKF